MINQTLLKDYFKILTAFIMGTGLAVCLPWFYGSLTSAAQGNTPIPPSECTAVLGDTILARRAEEGSFSVNDLMLYSAISGAGLDLVPIPGATAPDEIAAVYLDMAALALATNKPLIGRLLPVPGKAVGQKVDFGLAGLVSGRVIPLKNLGAQKLFEQSSFLKWEK